MLDLLNSLAVSFDLPILEWIQANLQSGLLDTIMPIITMLGDGGIFWIVCSVLFTLHPKTRRMGIAMAIAMAMGLVICNMILKPVVGRMRPYDYQINILGKTWNDLLVAGKLLVDTPHDYSFPSGHTIACFEASVAIMLSNKKLGIPALIIAVLVAFSRMYLYVHYPTDVIASIFLGSLFAVIGHIVAQRMKMPTISKNGKYQRK
jgi:undecaprenyl-diphosphatase